MTRRLPIFLLLCAALASSGCGTSHGSTSGAPGAAQGLGGGSGASAGASGSGGQGSFTEAYLPAGVRRMTVREFTNTVAQLLGTEREFSSLLPHDVPQQGYSRNLGQLVDPVFARQLQYTAEQLAAETVAQRLSLIAPCSSNPGVDCAKTFIHDFGERAYRRPLGDDELAQLLALYALGADGRPDAASQFASGIQFLLEAMLQAPSFIYLSQIGEFGSSGAMSALDQWELAATLSYLVVAGPPDEALRAAAAAGQLSSSEQRRAHAERLIATPAGRAQVRAFIREWLHLDKLSTIDKSDPRFASLRQSVLDETNDFVDEVMLNDDGSLGRLLTAGYTVVGPELAAFYGVSPDANGRASLAGTGRVGLLQQAAFLAANSAANVSSPVKRGAVFFDRLTCTPIPLPSLSVGVIKQPPPDPKSTTRELFAVHATDSRCSGCHTRLDGVGFLFENFGPIGEQRSEESGKPIDTSGSLKAGLDVDGPSANSVELSYRLAQSKDIRRCFARQLYRYSAADNDPNREETFLRGLEAEGTLSDRVHALIPAFVASQSFLIREQPTPGGGQ
ncbi:MAG TPA: DUF1592 domain-containing protein [Polyangiaceae bacterium]|nr:DUF1592 domain-containing protein [Polyangiaceae bacterium]